MNACRQPSMLRWVLCLILACASIFPLQAAPSEYVVKTAFLYNFFKFIDWPPATSSQAHFVLCATGGADEFINALSAIDGRVSGGKRISVRTNVQGEALKDCQMVFVHENDPSKILHEIGGLPIVTVGEGDGFVNRGGMIGLVQVDNRLSFEINLEPVQASGMRISAQMLKLAKSVRGAN